MKSASDLLSSSGLLVVDNNHDGTSDGLFDQVDKEEEEEEERERLRQIEEDKRQRRQYELEQQQQEQAERERIRLELENERRLSYEAGRYLKENQANEGKSNVGTNNMGLNNTQNLQQSIQQAGFGDASYYYSTTGNNVQQYSNTTNRQNHLNNTTNLNNPQQLQSSSVNSMVNSSISVSNSGNTTSYAMRSQLRQQQQQKKLTSSSSAVTKVSNSESALLNNTKQTSANKLTPITCQHEEQYKPEFGEIMVTDPILVQSPGLFFSSPPHWSYNIVVRDTRKIEIPPTQQQHDDRNSNGTTKEIYNNTPSTTTNEQEFHVVTSSVRRRFRHLVALEDRLRSECPGSILPPLPDKHRTRALDEATTHQSAQFAMQRSLEMQIYLNALRLHPQAGSSSTLRLFLTLPDHIGVAWPEVSSSIITRITEVGTNKAVKVISEGTTAVISELSNEYQTLAGEDDAELLALASLEGVRMGGVLQAVPKIESSVSLVGEYAERLCVTGLEVQRLVKVLQVYESDIVGPMDVLAHGLLKSGRRTKKLSADLIDAVVPFDSQYKLCKYERLAFKDRRDAVMKKSDARKEADQRSYKLMANQHNLQLMGKFGTLEKMEMEAAVTDDLALETVQKAERISKTLKSEVTRISNIRRKEWTPSLLKMAKSMKEAYAERAAIWEHCQNTFLNEYTNPQLEGGSSSHYSLNAREEQGEDGDNELYNLQAHDEKSRPVSGGFLSSLAMNT
jgi:hypothetical protein